MSKINRPTQLSLLGLTLLLGACGQSVTPHPSTAVQPAPDGMVRLNITARATAGTTLRPQGLPTAYDGSVPAGTFAVTVRDSSGIVMTFTNGAYSPGTGSPVLTLNTANTFGASVLLPIGTYSFETADKPDSGEDMLLAYGAPAENTQIVDRAHGSVALKLHAVFDPVQSSLAPAVPGTVAIHDLLNLRLFGKTGYANDNTYTVPSGDLVLTSYTVGAPEQGALNGAGSTLGVSVVAGDVPSGSTLNVTANFQAWIRTGSTDAASLQPQTLVFSTPVSRTSPSVAASMQTVNAMANTATTLYGTASSGAGIASVRVYDAGVLIGSTDPAEQNVTVSAITFAQDGSGHNTSAWSMPWTPSTDGAHDLSVRVANLEGKVTYALPTSPP